MKADIVQMVKDFYDTCTIINRINHTQISLVPKNRFPECLSKFCLISCCNFLYKVISKTMANRLRKIMSKLISPFQTAFLPHRSIQKNVIITHEALHRLKGSQATKRGSMVMKLDMEKAYDQIDWDFLTVC